LGDFKHFPLIGAADAERAASNIGYRARPIPFLREIRKQSRRFLLTPQTAVVMCSGMDRTSGYRERTRAIRRSAGGWDVRER
jgi:hypothetical protein